MNTADALWTLMGVLLTALTLAASAYLVLAPYLQGGK